ncbi:hypothetical protein [Rhodococcus sp. Q]|uniref:DUF7257 domain-containing protein n=1 Tax=Rhodococcus sp. Q TaxID=2502252 RepID=UPI0010F82172|nr:hypothetical protein [Rhodococcus sp. Q]
MAAIGGNWKAITERSQSATTTAQTRSSDATWTVASAQAVADSTRATIEALTPPPPVEQPSGATFSDDFERTQLGSGYSTYKFGQVADLTIVGGQVQLNQQGDKGTGNVVALSKTVLRTDDQSVSAVMGRANQAGTIGIKRGTTLYIRAAPDLATFVYVVIMDDEVRLGRGTRTTGLNYNQWVAAEVPVRTGDTVTLRAVGANYQVLINGVPVVAYNDSAMSSPVGAGNRSFGFDSWYYWSGLFGFFSFAIAALTAGDLASPPVTGVIGSFAGMTDIDGNWKAVADSTRATIEALTPPPPVEQPSGATFSDDFERTQLGSGYSTYKFGQVADLTIVSGQVQLNQQGDTGTGNVVALSNTVLRTDDQSVSAVMGRANQAGTIGIKRGTTLYIRAAPDLATFVYVVIMGNEVRLGRGTRTTGLNYNQWVAAEVPVRTGDTVTLRAVGANYQVLINGVPVVAYNDSAMSSPVGAGNRSFGFDSWYYWSGLIGFFSFAIAALTAGDLASPPVTGIGWALARIGSTNALQTAGSRPVAAGTFDTVRHSSAVTVSALGPGQVQVPVSGWYRMSVGLTYAKALTTEIGADLWWVASPGATWQQLRTGPKTVDTQDSWSVEATFVVFLPAGAVVAPGYSSSVNNNLIGSNTYFDGALINRA